MTKEVADHLTFKDLIWIKPESITRPQCASCIEWFWNNDDLHQQGQVYGGDDSITNASLHTNLERKNTIQAYPSPDDPISDFMTEVMTDGWKEYSKTLPTPQGQPMSFSDYSVRVYYKGQGKFLEHVDQSAGPNVIRTFGIILYLNTVEEGGETDFMDYKLKIKPEAGKLVIFPCNYLFRHEGTIPLSEDKYIITSFLNLG
tara:strand:- start:2948 stop:3550 length:603 start_codon:yes stop_codon:yes gene_type:complete